MTILRFTTSSSVEMSGLMFWVFIAFTNGNQPAKLTGRVMVAGARDFPKPQQDFFVFPGTTTAMHLLLLL
jgi:hypothetical protein